MVETGTNPPHIYFAYYAITNLSAYHNDKLIVLDGGLTVYDDNFLDLSLCTSNESEMLIAIESMQIFCNI